MNGVVLFRSKIKILFYKLFLRPFKSSITNAAFSESPTKTFFKSAAQLTRRGVAQQG